MTPAELLDTFARAELLEVAREQNPVRGKSEITVVSVESCELDCDPPIAAIVDVEYLHRGLAGDCFRCAGMGYLPADDEDAGSSCRECGGSGRRTIVERGRVCRARYGVRASGEGRERFELWAN